MKRKSFIATIVMTLVLCITLITPLSAIAASTQFFGEDLGLGESTPLSTWPNAAAAEADFLSHLTGVGTEDFESFAAGTVGPLAVDFTGSGVTATITDSGDGEIVHVPTGSTNSYGRYAISPTKFWEATQDFTIEFSQPIAAFGFYGVDIGDFQGQVVLEFINGGSQTYTINNTVGAPGGSVLYYGIIEDDPAKLFDKVVFSNTNPTGIGADVFAFDDFTIGTTEQVVPPVPEAPAFILFGIGLIGLVGYWKFRSSRSKQVQLS
jgi:hypothetical protein